MGARWAWATVGGEDPRPPGGRFGGLFGDRVGVETSACAAVGRRASLAPGLCLSLVSSLVVEGATGTVDCRH